MGMTEQVVRLDSDRACVQLQCSFVVSALESHVGQVEQRNRMVGRDRQQPFVGCLGVVVAKDRAVGQRQVEQRAGIVRVQLGRGVELNQRILGSTGAVQGQS